MSMSITRRPAARDTVTMTPGIIVGLLIGIVAFLLSFDALRLLFQACGTDPRLAWGGPVCVDGTIILTAWAAWGWRKAHLRHAWYPWAGFCLFTVCSILGNALNAYLTAGGLLPVWADVTVMSLPPVALAYSTHLVMIIAGDRHDRNTPAEPLMGERRAEPEPQSTASEPNPIPAGRNTPAEPTVGERQAGPEPHDTTIGPVEANKPGDPGHDHPAPASRIMPAAVPRTRIMTIVTPQADRHPGMTPLF